MISVAISINGTPILARSARNTGTQTDDGYTLYIVDDGTVLKHKPKDGAVVLAKQMLDCILKI